MPKGKPKSAAKRRRSMAVPMIREHKRWTESLFERLTSRLHELEAQFGVLQISLERLVDDLNEFFANKYVIDEPPPTGVPMHEPKRFIYGLAPSTVDGKDEPLGDLES